jgi:hypothetical protein
MPSRTLIGVGVAPHGVHEVCTVGGLAHRAGGDRQDVVGAMSARHLGQLVGGGDAAVEGLGRDGPFAQAGFAEAHHALGVFQNLDGPVRGAFHDHQVERVRSDIQRGDFLGGFLRAFGRAFGLQRPRHDVAP